MGNVSEIHTLDLGDSTLALNAEYLLRVQFQGISPNGRQDLSGALDGSMVPSHIKDIRGKAAMAGAKTIQDRPYSIPCDLIGQAGLQQRPAYLDRRFHEIVSSESELRTRFAHADFARAHS